MNKEKTATLSSNKHIYSETRLRRSRKIGDFTSGIKVLGHEPPKMMTFLQASQIL